MHLLQAEDVLEAGLTKVALLHFEDGVGLLQHGVLFARRQVQVALLALHELGRLFFKLLFLLLS